MVVEVLEHSRYAAALGQRLHALAAELGRMAGWASFDAGLHAAAQRYWIGALHAAHASGDRMLGANVLKSMSLQCYDFALPHEALALAQSAYAGTKQSIPRARAMLALREARAHAALGDANACVSLVSAAEKALGKAQSQDENPAWLNYFDDSEFYAQVGTCFLDLGQHRRADEYFSKTLELAPETKVRDRATYVIRRASAQASIGNSDKAANLISTAIPLIREAPSERNTQRIFRAREKLQFSKNDVRAQVLDEQLAELVAR
jgi:tetratricopeptide (TPR) repeat protein